MKRVKLIAPKKAIIEDIAIPDLKPNEILMRIAYCGICGSDLHASIGKHPFVPLPATPGHEFSGWVEKVGKNVTKFKNGDRVTAEPNLVCGECYNCKTGRYNICNSLRVMGCQGDGAMAEYFKLPANKAIRIPDELSLKHAVLIEPIAVGTHAIHKAGDLFGKNVVIIGSGMIGLGVLAGVKKAGANKIWISDFTPSRLNLALDIGADRILNATDNIISIIKKEASFTGIDIVFECVGNSSALRTSMELIRKGGKVIVMGVYEDEVRIKAADLQDREIQLIGTLMYTRQDFQDAIHLLLNGDLPSDKIIGKIFKLDYANEAFDYARNHKETIKTIIEINCE